MLGKGDDLVTPANLKDFQKSEVSSCFSNASARGVKEVHRALMCKYLISNDLRKLYEEIGYINFKYLLLFSIGKCT